ncbi:hypothetical protein GCM10008018_53890 [Paenibacillus marchantiophytorum]|uniref:Fe/B12 periplasmic-binding domain-containing protein n=1 Tax=Paenibacillus marchantiophytorum TaxID=1619310 RepID=A0ABQ1F6Q1_9BACL|nr:ABC transporter substrate-binding protein [Paenibacillus marchantiophytorum]GGA00776.1 hypothetical protein GCM10008018_53890 [Paenibacillus marchantiophytorum]
MKNSMKNTMKPTRKVFLAFTFIALIGASMTACSNSGNSNQQATTHKYMDYKGHQVDIPLAPQRIIFSGETFSDLLALNVKVIGTDISATKGTVYEKQLNGIEDIGFPINFEKSLNLNPDLIIVANTDEKAYEQLSKIAPTVMFDTFASLEERIPLLGEIIGKKAQADQWLANYKVKVQTMIKELQAAGVKPGETASVFTYYPGDRLFVMARAGLSQVLYHSGNFKPTPPIQSVLDEKSGFKQISLELLPEFAGDRIFILTPTDEEAKRSTDAMINSSIWRNLSAVKNNHVYTLPILQSGSDAITREWLLQELPKMINK